MLFTDSDIIIEADLTAIDPQCAAIAAKEQDPLDIPTIITKSIEEIGHELMASFQNYSGYLVSPGMPLNHVAAVNNIFSTSISRPRMRLNQVVASGPDPSMQLVKHWLVYYTLKQIYRSAVARYTAQKGDRYKLKMDMFTEDANAAWDRIMATGVPVVLVPLPCPGAVREPGAGTFGSGNVTHGGSGSGDPGMGYLVAITWTGAAYVSPSNPAQNESAPSAQVSLTVAPNEYITVNINGLTPPASVPPNVGTADGLYTQVAATGWNIYVGIPDAPLYLQTSSPLPIGTTSHQIPKPTLSGAVAGVGQWADYEFAFQRVRMRA